MENNEQVENQPSLCVNNCGFFGNPNTNNLCSKCYQSKKRKEVDSATAEVEKSTKQQKLDFGPIQPRDAESDLKEIPSLPITKEELKKSIDTIEKPAEKKPEGDSNRCAHCTKKIPLTAIKCRCGYRYCAKHRYSDQHNCTFDYKEIARKELIEKNPKVVASKIETL